VSTVTHIRGVGPEDDYLVKKKKARDPVYRTLLIFWREEISYLSLGEILLLIHINNIFYAS